MYALNKWTDGAVRHAIVDFNEAIAADADFAPAYAALAEAHVWFYSSLGILPAAKRCHTHGRAVDRALTLEPNLAHAHKVRGLIAMNHDWDRGAAEQALTRALQLGPGSASAHLWNAWRLALLEKRHDLALIELEEAERLDPLDLQVKTQIGYVHHFRHDLDRAIAQFEKVVALEPSFAFAHYALGDACTQRGQFDRAIDGVQQSHRAGRPVRQPRWCPRLPLRPFGKPRPRQRAPRGVDGARRGRLRLPDVVRARPPRPVGSRESSSTG